MQYAWYLNEDYEVHSNCCALIWIEILILVNSVDAEKHQNEHSQTNVDQYIGEKPNLHSWVVGNVFQIQKCDVDGYNFFFEGGF